MKIPFAIQFNGKMRERGDYPEPGGPEGCVIHTTDGRFDDGLKKAFSTMAGGIKNGYTFLDIARTGELVQAHDILKWGHHCGESAWLIKLAKQTVMKKSLSSRLIGIEQNNAGKVKRINGKFYAWWDHDNGKVKSSAVPIPDSDVRYVDDKIPYVDDHGKVYKWNVPSGYWHKLSIEQEETLERTILWMYVNCAPFKLENVVAHHEISGMKGLGYWRKVDVGGCLSMPMEAYRARLTSRKNELIAKWNIVKV